MPPTSKFTRLREALMELRCALTDAKRYGDARDPAPPVILLDRDTWYCFHQWVVMNTGPIYLDIMDLKRPNNGDFSFDGVIFRIHEIPEQLRGRGSWEDQYGRR